MKFEALLYACVIPGLIGCSHNSRPAANTSSAPRAQVTVKQPAPIVVNENEVNRDDQYFNTKESYEEKQTKIDVIDGNNFQKSKSTPVVVQEEIYVSENTKSDGRNTDIDKPKDDQYNRKEYYKKSAADNTGINKRDRKNQNVTPLDQSEKSVDLKITQQIRQSIVGDDNLSFNSKNVKIVTTHDKIYLRGPVPNENERTLISKHAERFAGKHKIENLIEINK